MARILLAEDDVDVRTIIAEALRQDGHAVADVMTAGEAGEHMRAGAWDVLVCSTWLRGGTAHALSAAAARHGAAVVFLSGDCAPAPAPGCGDVPVLRKPFRLAELRHALEWALRSRPQMVD